MVNRGSLAPEEISMPLITSPRSNEPAPWLKSPIQLIIQNHIQRKVDPERSAIAGTSLLKATHQLSTSTPMLPLKQTELHPGHVSLKKQTKKSEAESQTTP